MNIGLQAVDQISLGARHSSLTGVSGRITLGQSTKQDQETET